VQQFPRPRIGVDPVHLLPTTLSEPEVSNFLARESWLILFTYSLQHSASLRSAISSSENRGCLCSRTDYNSPCIHRQQLYCPRALILSVSAYLLQYVGRGSVSHQPES